MDSESTSHHECHQHVTLPGRRLAFLEKYQALPPFGSSAFWQELEAESMPLEVLVRCIRKSNADGDSVVRNGISEILIKRTQRTNDSWVKRVFQYHRVSEDERYAFMYDLYADLYERIVRAVLDASRTFWEENFAHSLVCERKHTYTSFMAREGLSQTVEAASGTRIPRMFLVSLDHISELEDEALFLQAENDYNEMQRSIEYAGLFHLVLCLPQELKAVISLIYWHKCSEKDVASLLGVTDRTVRNRIRKAVEMLSDQLQQDGEFHG